MENIIFPSPKDLAKKEATRPISIRVKEKTMLSFEKLAQQYGVTASAMINNLLDAYVASFVPVNTRTEKNVSRRVMSQYLEKLASRIDKYTDEELCLTLAEDREHANIENLLPRDYLWYAINDPSECTMSVFLGDALNTEFRCDDIKEATAEHTEQDSLMINVPIRKFPVVGYIMSSYAMKNENLYNGERKQIIDKKSIDEIVKAINSGCNRLDLAKKISKILAAYESPADEGE